MAPSGPMGERGNGSLCGKDGDEAPSGDRIYRSFGIQSGQAGQRKDRSLPGGYKEE